MIITSVRWRLVSGAEGKVGIFWEIIFENVLYYHFYEFLYSVHYQTTHHSYYHLQPFIS